VPAAYAAIAAKVDEINAMLEASGQTVRLDYPWLFVVGNGTDPFARLRTGARWTTLQPTYILDASDYTTDISAAAVDATLVSAYETWNDVPQSGLTAARGVDDGGNFDFIDGFYDAGGNCLFPLDFTSPNLISFDFNTGLIEFLPEADIVVGGWVQESYFSSEGCLDNPNIIGVTWTLSDIDRNGDQYRDRIYVEQFYNVAFDWVISGSTFLDPTSGVDLETVAAHENGHAHGLGHFGGPVRNQTLKLHPHDRVFSPEAVMNGGYFFGEARDLYPTDEAALLTMYAR
jgi:hypothetical protein